MDGGLEGEWDGVFEGGPLDGEIDGAPVVGVVLGAADADGTYEGVTDGL
jgi:hypothetical protein